MGIFARIIAKENVGWVLQRIEENNLPTIWIDQRKNTTSMKPMFCQRLFNKNSAPMWERSFFIPW